MKENHLLIFLFVFYSIKNKILTHNNNLELSKPYEYPRNLRLRNTKIQKTYNFGKVADKETGKLNFMKIMLKILKHAHNRKLDIKNIKLGKGLKKKFNNPFIVDDMKSFLKAKNIKNKIQIMQKKIKSQQRKLKISKKVQKRALKAQKTALKAQKAQLEAQKRKRYLTALPSVPTATDTPANTMGFNFLPGFAGMPFPPFMMQGPHFHPPINMTVNSIPNPNPQADLNPFEIEQSNLKTQLDELSSIKTKLLGLGTKMSSIDQQIGDGLEDKYTKIMQLNV